MYVLENHVLLSPTQFTSVVLHCLPVGQSQLIEKMYGSAGTSPVLTPMSLLPCGKHCVILKDNLEDLMQ